MSELLRGKCGGCSRVTWLDSDSGKTFNDAEGEDEHWYPHECLGAKHLTIARQARTIRRLFTAYFLAKAKLQHQEVDRAFWVAQANKVPGLSCALDEANWNAVHAAKEERARIVAALRERAEGIRRIVKAMQAVPHPDYRQIEYDQARADGFMSAADTIERGEL